MNRFRSMPRELALLSSVVCALVLYGSPAGAERARRGRGASVWDREVQRLRDEVARRGRHEDAVVPLIELGSRWLMAPDRVVTFLHDLGNGRRILPSLRFYARVYEADLLRNAGRRAEAERLTSSFGFVRRWRVIGPFDNNGRHGFDTVYGPERDLERGADLDAEYEGFERTVQWSTLPDLGPGEGVPLDSFFTPSTDVCVYAETFVELDRARPLAILAGAGGAVRVWWNGRLAVQDTVYRAADIDRVAGLVEGRAGWNRILVKDCSDDRGMFLFLRVAEADGSALVLRADPDGARASSPAPETPIAMPSSPPRTILAALESAVAGDSEDASAFEALARYLQYSHGADPTTNRVRDLADRAVELGPTARNLLFAADQQGTRADRMRLIEQAVDLAPRSPEVAYEHAFLVYGGPGGERALTMLEAIPPTTPYGLFALDLRAAVISRLGLGESQHEIYEELARRVPGSPHYLGLLADSETERGHASRASDLRRRLLEIYPEHFEVRRVLVREAIARADHDEVRELVGHAVEQNPVSRSVLLWASEAFESVGDETEAIDSIRRATDLDPGDASVRVRLGRILLRTGHRDAALAALREALRLRPQDGATRRLIEQIEPEARSDEELATPMETILARRRPDGAYSATVLHDLEVHTVHESGLSSRFCQVAIQIHDDEGARQYRTYSFTYEPGSQWVEVRSAKVYRGGEVLASYTARERSLARPAYRIYYSARRVEVTFPVLRPGDVIELRYRIEDVTSRNAYADYFGALRQLQYSVPVAHLEQVFRTPTSRRFFFRTTGDVVSHTQETRDNVRVDRFVGENIAAIRLEPYMPGTSEVAPILHVSTFETWDQVGRFFWDLVEEQLQPDASLERTVQELIAGTSDTRERIERIYAWATDHVRYVGLEFGIHGHQPYRVTDVVQRGYGDCKDTAALLYVMLRLAGIEARIALVRTRSLGAIETRPASLEIFDHAVAYVPALDLFLDGTAEQSGITELPEMDQGGLALLVGPEGAALRQIPTATPNASGRTRRLTITFAADGSATVSGEAELRWWGAMNARRAYAAQSTRRDRLSRSLARIFPGIELDQEAFESLDDRERPVRYTWSGHVPSVGEREGARLRIAPSTLEGLTRQWASLPARTHPLVLSSPFHYRERRALECGALNVEDVPANGSAESPFGRLTVQYTRRGDEVVVQTDLLLLRDRIAPNDYPAFRRWVEAADALLRQRIVLGGVR